MPTPKSLPRISLCDQRLGAEPIPFGWANAEWRSLVSAMQPNDELWEFYSPQLDWDQMMGTAGIALVRDGVVVDRLVCRMN